MITCKQCKKIAKLKAVFINGCDEVKLVGSCKHCGYDEKINYPKGTLFSQIPVSKIDYDDFDELGIDR
jgi:RNase P subunit RPR2